MSQLLDPLRPVILPPRVCEMLPRLRMPKVEGLRVLDVSCGDGFYCGFAQYLGAREVIGWETCPEALRQARARHPDVHFEHNAWDSHSDQKFDVILVTRADQLFKSRLSLIDQWLSMLNPEGVLILEIALDHRTRGSWGVIDVPEGAQEELVEPDGLRQYCRSYAYRVYTYRSTSLSEHLPTAIVHVKNKRPFACLLMMPSAYGKSSVARTMFDDSALKVISGDLTFNSTAQGKSRAPEELKHLFAGKPHGLNVARLVHDAIKENLHLHLVDMVLEQACMQNCVLDMYFPPSVHQEIYRHVESKGYFPILMNWQQLGLQPMSLSESQETALDYAQAIATQSSGAKRFLY